MSSSPFRVTTTVGPRPVTREFAPMPSMEPTQAAATSPVAEATRGQTIDTARVRQTLSQIRGQAQFVLYLADRVEESLEQVGPEVDPGEMAFLCRVLSMYAAQLESKHQGLGDRIAEACQDVYMLVRDCDVM